MGNETQEQVTTQQANVASDQIAGDLKQTQKYIDEQMYRNNLLQTYLNKIEGKDQVDTDRQRSIFVTMARGIISDIQAGNPDAQVGRTGDYTWAGVFDTAWEALYPKVEEPPMEQPVEESKPPVQIPAQQTAPIRRSPGDIQPVDDGEELEGYVEKLGLADYAKVRNEHRMRTKTLKNYQTNVDILRESMKSKTED